MLIKDQSSTILFPWENGECIMIDDFNTNRKIYVILNNEDKILLGEYNTEERTLEVLNDLMLSYVDETCKCYMMPLE